MARQLRIEYPGAIYHVLSRGDRREPIFADDADRKLFLETLGQACAKTEWQVQALKAYRWSSYPEYLRPPGQRPAWLRVDRLFGEMHIPKDSEAGRRQFELSLEQWCAQETGQEWKELRRGWCFGDKAFRQELLAQVHEQAAEFPFGVEKRESAAEKADRIVAEQLSKLGWDGVNSYSRCHRPVSLLSLGDKRVLIFCRHASDPG